ncbi:MAG: YebC/PmpR family DNA-binding transcriptional regulator [Bacteroidetes bacterium]|nr:YebC/PmpR family DNA-binding transcriptional regulator [Bacteroidota bacterium]
MGRAFEKRKHKMFARYDKMAKAFTRLGKEIAIAVKQGGPHVDGNPRLKAAMQTAKGLNMPKDRIEAAIQRASNKNEGNFEELVYEGYAPYGVAILCETATDNNNRTVANIRSYYTKAGGTLGKTGSLDFIFTRKGVFILKADGIDPDELELELIDHGLEELFTDQEENQIIIHTAFSDFSKMQKALESMKVEVVSSEFQRLANTFVELNEEQEEEVMKLIEKMEQDDDIQFVYHNIK